MAAALTDSKQDEGGVKYASGNCTKEVTLVQQQKDWTAGITKIAEVTISDHSGTAGEKCTLSAESDGNVTITIGSGS